MMARRRPHQGVSEILNLPVPVEVVRDRRSSALKSFSARHGRLRGDGLIGLVVAVAGRGCAGLGFRGRAFSFGSTAARRCRLPGSITCRSRKPGRHRQESHIDVSASPRPRTAPCTSGFPLRTPRPPKREGPTDPARVAADPAMRSCPARRHRRAPARQVRLAARPAADVGGVPAGLRRIVLRARATPDFGRHAFALGARAEIARRAPHR